MGRKHGEAATGDEFLELLAMDHALEQYIVQIQFSCQRFEAGTLGTVSRDDQRSVWQAHHGAQELIDAFLWREPAEVEDVSFVGGEVFIVGQSLKVRQKLNALRKGPAVDPPIAHGFTASQGHVPASFV